MSRLHRMSRAGVYAECYGQMLDHAIRIWQLKNIDDNELRIKLSKLRDDITRMTRNQLIKVSEYYRNKMVSLDLARRRESKWNSI